MNKQNHCCSHVIMAYHGNYLRSTLVSKLWNDDVVRCVRHAKPNQTIVASIYKKQNAKTSINHCYSFVSQIENPIKTSSNIQIYQNTNQKICKIENKLLHDSSESD